MFLNLIIEKKIFESVKILIITLNSRKESEDNAERKDDFIV